MWYNEAEDTKETYLHRRVELAMDNTAVQGEIIETKVILEGRESQILCKIRIPQGSTWLTVKELQALKAFQKVEICV